MEPRPFSRRNLAKKRRASTITVPEHVGPHERLVFCELRRQGVTYDQVEDGSGVLRTTIKAWRSKNKPGLESIEAVLGLLGWDFIPIPRRAIPPELIAELKPIADKLGISMKEATTAVMTIAAGIHERFPAPLAEAA